ncbi:bifunctional 4-hydroxy-2-oxoglutarate aldolase/2-dehydro-3-deoxy-phosphogluconate aldolase [Alkalihalobacillus trypoxylicola]|uniref:2-dehydro-3-deoxyphosphogluconate aldolase n=1 Tax=Alkalihalobacillus trypoxylicola TaxID=519424 RepID=A0A162FBY3_9BACI|nr:bifunctional 4-hydroxy-2-oxoglutarate aldolase/2-dehydro-3-deoxy-phosphogluconate aldolase [Alkalihalobacillus trypoxylicola]KYG35245.1 2-dehydro-3-deoxyphosphogluconate aldolase [Alkalihalobacillus trypoxylicola]
MGTIIEENGLVAIVRGAGKEQMLKITDALLEGGIKTIEITVETPKVLSLIEAVRNEFDQEAFIGSGTVLDPETARSTIMAGAQFVFSPTVNTETIKMTKRYGVISVPGAMTPTEILTAYEHGADLIKVFPARSLGPSYLKDIHGPLPHIPLMPTGGVNVENLPDFIKAGAVAVGLGSNLVNTKVDFDETERKALIERAKQYVATLEEARAAL